MFLITLSQKATPAKADNCYKRLSLRLSVSQLIKTSNFNHQINLLQKLAH